MSADLFAKLATHANAAAMAYDTQFVYFQIEANSRQSMRIGWSGSILNNTKRHRAYDGLGFIPYAFMPVPDKTYERELHAIFEPHLMPVGRDIYMIEPVKEYADWLVAYNWATRNFIELPTMSIPQWAVIDPLGKRAPIPDHGPAAHYDSFGFNLSGTALADDRDCWGRDDWETPSEWIALVKDALGGAIELDPCSSPSAQQRMNAKSFFNKTRTNGLMVPWYGSVYMAPPYSEPKIWVRKLIHEVNEGRVEKAIACLNSQSMATRWFQEVYANAPIMAIPRRRIRFYGPLPKSGSGIGTRYGASQNGTVFCFFGKGVDDMERFYKVFEPHANIQFGIRSKEVFSRIVRLIGS